eukprot:Pgem_evm1s20190
MNACVIHLLAFFKAKWMYAEYIRLKQSTVKTSTNHTMAPLKSEEGQHKEKGNQNVIANDNGRLTEHQRKMWESECLDKVLQLWNCPPDVKQSCRNVCYVMEVGDVEIIREFFGKIGMEKLKECGTTLINNNNDNNNENNKILENDLHYAPKNKRRESPA